MSNDLSDLLVLLVI